MGPAAASEESSCSSRGSSCGIAGRRAGRGRTNLLWGVAAAALAKQVEPVALAHARDLQRLLPRRGGARDSLPIVRHSREAARSHHTAWGSSTPSGRRERVPRVARRPAGIGVIEAALAATALVTFLSRPRSAPGPSEELLQRERRARKAVEMARDALRKAPENSQAAQKGKQTLAEAKRVLFDVERELEEAGADLKAFPLPPYLENASCPGQIRIAVTGASGVGKSSFINAIRRLRPNDKDAAKTGVTETTLEPTMYRFRGETSGPLRKLLDGIVKVGKNLAKALVPIGEGEESLICLGDRVMLKGLGWRAGVAEGTMGEVVGIYPEGDVEVQLDDGGKFQRCRRDQLAGVLPECVLFDLPGVGTPTYPQATYLKEMGLRHYDFVVLITSTRFTEAELLLLEGLEYWGVPYFLVRNKADVDVQSEIDKIEEIEGVDVSSERRKLIEADTIKSIRDFFKKEFNLNKIYLVSSKRKLIDQFDFRGLETDMEEALKKQRIADGLEAQARAAALEAKVTHADAGLSQEAVQPLVSPGAPSQEAFREPEAKAALPSPGAEGGEDSSTYDAQRRLDKVNKTLESLDEEISKLDELKKEEARRRFKEEMSAASKGV